MQSKAYAGRGGSPPSKIRFGPFELDIRAAELRKEGLRIRLQDQPFEILRMLLDRPGEVVLREEIRDKLWPDGTVVEFDHSINAAIKRLRDTLRDSAETPRYIETLARRGYRFVATVEAEPSVTPGVVARDPSIAVESLEKPDVKSAPDPIPTAQHAPAADQRVHRPRARWYVAAAAVAIAITFLALYAGRTASRSSNELATLSPAVPLTTYPGDQQSPSLSPDGSQVAFSWNGPGGDNDDIYVKLVGPGQPIRLTKDAARDDQPAWSPDGQLIAFHRFRSESAADIFVIPALGGAERKVASVNFLARADGSTSTHGWSGNLAWTPDGKWLAFGGAPSDNEAPGIWLVALKGAEQRRLTTVSAPDFGEWAPAFTGDGRYVAFIRERTLSTSMVYVMPLLQMAPAGPPQRVSPDGASILGLAWKPDGSGILLSLAGHLGLSRTYSIPFRPGQAADRRDVRLLPFGERARGISVARNGRIVYAAQFRDANIWRMSLASQNQPSQAPIAASTLDEQTPDYSPDGKRLAFASTRSGVEEIWLANADGSNPKQMTSTGGPQCSNPRWSPDGSLILFNSRREGSADLYLLVPETGELRRITNHPDEELEPRWSRDGRTIYFGSNRTGRYEIWRMPAMGGEPVQITKRGGQTGTESPDGPPSAIWRVPVSSGEEEPIVGGLSYALNFVVAKRGIYFLAVAGARNQTSLDFFEYATGKRSTLASVGKPFWWGMALSPDEKSLLYSVVDSAGSNLMLVDNFR